MKKRVLGILLASVLTLALAGCAGDSNTESNSTDPNTTSQVEQSEASDTTSDTMDEASYMEKVNALPDAITDFSNDMAEIMSTMSTAASQEDLDALLPQLEDLRAYEQPYLAMSLAIENVVREPRVISSCLPISTTSRIFVGSLSRSTMLAASLAAVVPEFMARPTFA